jgi:general secretion pathway protein M
MNAMQARFQALNPRDRAIVIVGGGLVVLALLYFLLLSPFYSAIDARGRRVTAKQADLAWLQGSLAEVQSLAASQPEAAGPTGESLVVLIDRTAREAGLGTSLTGQTPAGDTGIRVRLETAPFDSVVQWLGVLQQRYAVSIESATIDRTAAQGIVNATLTLQRAGGG